MEPPEELKINQMDQHEGSEYDSDEDDADERAADLPETQNGTPHSEPVKKKERPKDARSREDFEFGDVLGEGSYAQVVIGKEIRTGREYAVKILNKKHIVRENKVEYVRTEKVVMDKLHNPSIVTLYFTFQDSQFLYFVLEYCPNGELFDLIHRNGSLDIDTARFYAAEILLALEHMHSMDIVHRDLKPENILLNKNMHAKITDFGTAKQLTEQDYLDDLKPRPPKREYDEGSDLDEPIDGEKRERANTFTGTAEYVSPEVLGDRQALPPADIWAFGCTLYQMIAGLPPFQAINEYHIFQKIQVRDFTYPDGFPEDIKDLVDRILTLNPAERLKIQEIKAHPFFASVNWATVATETPPVAKTGMREKPAEDVKPAGNAFNQFDGVNDVWRAQALSEQRGQVWSKFLFPNELIVHMGPISKRKRFSTKKRQLILTDFPRLIYIDPVKLVQKGEIEWTRDLRPELGKKKQFFIHTPGRTYNMECLTDHANEWIEAILQAKEVKDAKETKEKH